MKPYHLLLIILFAGCAEKSELDIVNRVEQAMVAYCVSYTYCWESFERCYDNGPIDGGCFNPEDYDDHLCSNEYSNCSNTAYHEDDYVILCQSKDTVEVDSCVLLYDRELTLYDGLVRDDGADSIYISFWYKGLDSCYCDPPPEFDESLVLEVIRQGVGVLHTETVTSDLTSTTWQSRSLEFELFRPTTTTSNKFDLKFTLNTCSGCVGIDRVSLTSN